MKKNKKTTSLLVYLLPLFMGITLLTLSSCEDEVQNAALETSEVELAQDEIMAEMTFDDVDEIASAAIDGYANEGGRLAVSDRLPECAIVVHDKEAKTLTIDFGEGCEGPAGNVRAGVIFIDYSDPRWVPGSVLIITFQNYTFNDILVEGTRTRTNTSATTGDFISINVVLEGGKLTFPDGTFATREVNRTRTWVRAANPVNDQVIWTGMTSGQTREGVNYTTTITNDVVFLRSCGPLTKFVPVQGTKVITRDEKPTVTIDFGDGTCDRWVTVSAEGKTKDVEINPRRHLRL